MTLYSRNRNREQDREPTKRQDGAHEPPRVPLPQETLEDRDWIAAAESEKQQWVDEAYADFVSKGGAEQLPGYGKPLKVPTGDILESIRKQANVEPPWLMLRREIGRLMALTLKLMDKSPDHPDIDAMLADANKQIMEMNGQAPSLSLHRNKLSRDNVADQYRRWYDVQKA